jgi:hypothetical protein
MPVFEFTQQVAHKIVVKADSLDQADEFVGGLGDDDFTDVEWGETTIRELDKDSDADEDISSESE